MLQRNDSGYTVTITAPVEWPRLPVAVDVQPGECVDLPDLLFGWTAVADGSPVVSVRPASALPVEAPADVAPAVDPPAPAIEAKSPPKVSIPRQTEPSTETEK